MPAAECHFPPDSIHVQPNTRVWTTIMPAQFSSFLDVQSRTQSYGTTTTVLAVPPECSATPLRLYNYISLSFLTLESSVRHAV